MTHEDLLKILDDQKIVRYRDYFIKTMKAAVNQVLDEAAEKAKVIYDNNDVLLAYVKKDSITSLKIK